MIDSKDGKTLLAYARECVRSELFGEKNSLSGAVKRFKEKQGVFVTIKKDGNLRGCIGFVIGHFPLNEGVKNAAHSAAFEDPRFNPIEKEEYDHLKFEISVLTVPEITKDIPDGIRIGEDGLIIEYGAHSGLLLPQVAEEWGWGRKEFLEYTCEKAGIGRNSWKEDDCIVKKFQAQIFSE